MTQVSAVGAKKNSKKLNRMIADLIADEIEKIKGFFYTKLKHDKNYPDLLQSSRMSDKEFELEVTTLFWENPQTALAYALRLLSEVKKPDPHIISSIFGPLVSIGSEVFIQYREFLSYFVDCKARAEAEELNRAEVIMYWEMPFIPHILKYIGQSFDRFALLGNFFAKMMLRINSNQLTFYLSQIFQSLDYSTSDIIENFIVKYSESSPLFAHQVVWMARVEEKADQESELAQNGRKRRVASGLPMKIIKNMGIEEKRFWDEVDSFFEQITKISSVLKPKMPKPEKREIINERLEHIKMPPLVYLPTNPDFRVLRIKLGSGAPMQSAAKCPIMVSFYCRRFEGPDRYFEDLKRRQAAVPLEAPPMHPSDMDENIQHNVGDMVNERSIVVKELILKDQSQQSSKDQSTARRQITASKLNTFTDELLPIFGKTDPTRTGFENSPGLEPLTNNGSKSTKGRQSYEFSRFARDLERQSQPPVTPLKKKLGKEKEQEEEQVVSCIFKTFDDIRRDNLALQVIRIFQEIFQAEKLDLFVFPYKTISTRTGTDKTIGGIIECVPQTFSRDQIGKENKYSLFEFFKEKYGSESSLLFQEARENFIKSMAAYSVVSYILQIKDRHNGNILIDQMGHLIHIDFGFIFDISPGKNLGFENAQFKLTRYSRLTQRDDRNHGRQQEGRAVPHVR